MGIFSNDIRKVSGKSSIVEDATLETLVQDDETNVSNISEDMEWEGNEAIGTIHENYNTIMTNIGLAEANHYESYGNEMVWTEGVLSNFVGMIKKFLKKIWEKIKGLFKRFTLMIDKYNMEDKAFVKKYRKELFNGKNLSDFKFKGYKFTINDGDITKALAKCTGSTERSKTRAGQGRSQFDADNYDDKHSDELEKFRGDVLSQFTGGKAGSYTQEEFTKELRELLRNGDSEKEELDQINVGTITGELMTSRDTKKTLDTMFKTSKKAIDQEEKEIERKQKEFLNKQPGEPGTGSKDSGHIDIDQLKRDIEAYKAKYPNGTKTSPAIYRVLQLNPDDDNDLKLFYDKYLKITKHKEFENLSSRERYGVQVLMKTDSRFINKPETITAIFNPSNRELTNDEYNTRAAREFNYYLRAVRDTKTCMIAIQTSVMAALKERSRQNKAICVKIIHYNPKSESYNEDYDYSTKTSGVNFLSSIELK